jgi:glycosyltransferase involved in cell wall biosynthesis
LKSKALIIVPAYNEQDSLPRTISELRFNAPSFDIVIVNDGSTDNTSQVAKQIGEKVIDLPFNLGIGGAVQTGFKYALQSGYDIVVQVDADGQHDACSLSSMIEPIISGKADIVVGSRYLGDNLLKMSPVRNLGIKYFSWLTSRLIGQKITDCSSGYRVFNRKTMHFFSDNYPVDFPDAEALILAHQHNLKILEVPAQFKKRLKGKSSLHVFRFLFYPIKETLSILMLAIERKVES